MLETSGKTVREGIEGFHQHKSLFFHWDSSHRFKVIPWDELYGKEIEFSSYDETYRQLFMCSCGAIMVDSMVYSWSTPLPAFLG